MPKFEETDNFIVDLREHSVDENISSNQESAKPVAKVSGNFWYFVRYNNAFLIMMFIAILAFGSFVFASDDVRGATIGNKQVYDEGVDNTLLLNTDLDSFNMDFKIIGIFEDEEKYLVSYSFVDLDIVDNNFLPNDSNSDESSSAVWQYVEKTATRRINKPFRKDLGVYLAQQLSQDAKARIKELKQKQKEAQSAGETKVVQVTQYSGLIGKVLDLSTTIFPGYEPIKKIELPTPDVNQEAQDRAYQPQPDNLTNVYNEWVNDNPDKIVNLNQNNAGNIDILSDSSDVASSSPASTTPTNTETSSADTAIGASDNSNVTTDTNDANNTTPSDTVIDNPTNIDDTTDNTSTVTNNNNSSSSQINTDATNSTDTSTNTSSIDNTTTNDTTSASDTQSTSDTLSPSTPDISSVEPPPSTEPVIGPEPAPEPVPVNTSS